MQTYHYSQNQAIRNVAIIAVGTVIFSLLFGEWAARLGDLLLTAIPAAALGYLFTHWHHFNESIQMGRDGFTLKKRIGTDREFPYADIKRVLVRETGKTGWLAKYADEEIKMTIDDHTGGSSDVRLNGLEDREDFIRRVKNGVEDQRGKLLFQDAGGEFRLSLKELLHA